MHSSGVGVTRALDVVKGAVGNEYLAAVVEYVNRRVRSGQGLASAMRETNEFPSVVVQMVSTAERTGKMQEALANVIRFFDREVDAAVRRVTTYMGPILLTALAAVLVLMGTAFYLPAPQIGDDDPMSMIELNTSAKRAGGSERGISMLEVTLLLGAMVILAAAVAPSLLRVLQDQRHDQVMEELKAIHIAINGDESDKTFGFVGDIGRAPVELAELVEIVDLEPFRISEETAVGYGWSGPYLNRGIGTEDWATDAWGNYYDIGAVGYGQVRSAGPNGEYDDDDDLVYPPHPVNPYGNVVVTIRGHGDGAIVSDPV